MSGPIRQQIGLSKGVLEKYLQEFTSDFQKVNLSKLTNEELEFLSVKRKTFSESFHKALKRLKDLDTEWSNRIQTDLDEQTAFDEYISKNGDYRDVIAKASQTSKDLAGLKEGIKVELASRKGSSVNGSTSSQYNASNGSEAGSLMDAPNGSSVPGSGTITPHTHAVNTATLLLQQQQTPRSNTLPTMPVAHVQPSPYLQLANLPKIDLKTFSGNSEEWTSFWEQFSLMIDESTLPNITKFTYLKSYFQGSAARLLQ